MFNYSGTAVTTDEVYKSDKVSVTLTRHVQEGKNRQVTFVADIYIQDITSLRTAFAGKTPLERHSVKSVKQFTDKLSPVILAVNGDYIAAKGIGTVVRNGVQYRAKEAGRYDICAITQDGVMHVFEGGTFKVQDVTSLNAWQVWCFGPSLLNAEGKAKTTFNSSLTSPNPRTAIGYYAPGHYCIVVADGRQRKYSAGMTMSELSKFMEELGCKAAYNLDGGSSTVMVFMDKQINKTSYQRKIPDIVYICEPDPSLLH